MTKSSALHRVRTYEELDGAQGREVFFRPHRYRAADLDPLIASIYVRREQEQPVRCGLVDISQSGVAFEWTGEGSIEVGDSIAELSVGFDSHIAYRGDAKVGSVRAQDDSVIVGVGFVDQLIDIDQVLQMRAIRAWRDKQGQGLSMATRSWSVPGHSQYKSLIAELALHFEDAQEQFAELEANLDWQIVQRASEPPAQTALIDRIKTEFAGEVVRATEEIDAALRQAPAAHRKALCDYSLRQLDQYLLQAPWMHRARFKPFGYPGDYEVMRFVYERNFEGPTLFAKAIGYAFLQTKAALAVKYRKDLMKQQLRNVIESHKSERPLRFLSIAAGPAQELVELMDDLPELPAPLEVVLFDQDKSALSYAFRRLKPAVEAKFGDRVKVLYLHESIKRLLRDADLFTSFGRFDAVYSVGLYDYLQTTTAVVLTRNLFSRLSPGGALYIGNMAPENPCRWFMEAHLDWHLIHRTREELSDIGRRASPGAAVRVLEEKAGVNPFIELRA